MSKIFTCLFAILFIVSIVGGVIADSYKNTINGYFELKDYRIETLVSDEVVDSEYFKSKYVQYNDDGTIKYITDENGYIHQVYDDIALAADAKKYAYQVQQEGTTILWNTADGSDTEGIPLNSGDAVSLFGATSVELYNSGRGSGQANNALAYTNFKGDMETAGFKVNSELWKYYLQFSDEIEIPRGTDYYRNTFEPAWSEMPSSAINAFSSYDDAAIISITRVAGEYVDCSMTGAETESGDYLGLSVNEKEMIEEVIQLKKDGVFKKVILLLNIANSINFKEIMPYKTEIDSCIWIGQGGSVGFQILPQILLGDIVTSGHLPDTFAMDGQSAPAAINGKSSTYTNYETFGLKTKDPFARETSSAYYIAYAEGIYVGYKYYETRYEDAVMGKGNASSTAGAVNSNENWKYSEEVAFPFGYSCDYTTFEYSNFEVVKNADNDDYTATVTVTNTGTVTSKDAVQIYIQKPYTEYDRMWGIEQASVNLCGFAKTKELAPGESQTLTIDIEADAFKTYDAYNKETYIREAGDYYFTAGQDAHNAVNNILAAKGYTPSNTNNVMDAEGNSDLVVKFNFTDDDYDTFSKSSTGYKITNQFNDVDWNRYENKTAKDLVYLSRNDWDGTYPKETFSISVNQEMKNDLADGTVFSGDASQSYPTYSADIQFSLIDMKGLAYDHEVWDMLLDQLSLKECVNMICDTLNGIPSITSIVSPGDKAKDGPLGIGSTYKTNSSARTTYFPISPLLGATFNKELAQQVGYIKGEDMLHSGYTSIYAPGANIHRTAYSGRNCEYYSEDAYLSGMMCLGEVVGIQETGCVPITKHFALNDQEDQRWGVAIWANEQSIREIYLEAFRYAVEDGDMKGMMSAFSRFGTKWSGTHYGLLTEVLRNEWGYDGYVLSDCPWLSYMNIVDGIVAGNDGILYSVAGSSRNEVIEAAEADPAVANAVRESTHRILYVLANSNTMNGFAANTIIIPVTNWWEYAIFGCQIGFGVLTILGVFWVAFSKKNY